MIVSRPMYSGEPDLLIGHEYQPLRIVSLEDELVIQYHAPATGWTHDALECVDYESVSPGGWDAYLGQQWIGSSEV